MSNTKQRRYHVVIRDDRTQGAKYYLTGYSMPHEEAVTFKDKMIQDRPTYQRLMLEEVPGETRWTPEQAIQEVREAALGCTDTPMEDRIPSRAQVLAYLKAAGFNLVEERSYKNAEGIIVDLWPEDCPMLAWPEGGHRFSGTQLSWVPREIVATLQDIAMAAAQHGGAVWNWARVAGVLCQITVEGGEVRL